MGARVLLLGLLLGAARLAGALRHKEGATEALAASLDEQQSNEGWQSCAGEGQAIATAGRVRFGWGMAWVEQVLPAGASCSLSSFGTDPMPGVLKVCECAADSNSPEQRSEMGVGWTRCATEGQDCSCSSGTVRFGTGTRWLMEEAAKTRSGPAPVQCSVQSFHGADPLPGSTKECWCMDKAQAAPAQAKVAIVMLTRHPADLNTWLQYHLGYMGVDRVFMEVEDSPELNATIMALPDALRQKVTVTWAGATGANGDRRPTDDYETLQKRQIAAMAQAKAMASSEGIEWLIHIDDDELLYTPLHRPVGSVLANMPDGFNQAYIPNVEAVYPSSEVKNCFKESAEVNVNRYTFNAYANGKAAVRVADNEAQPAGPHQWRDAYNQEPASIHLDKEPFGPPLMVVHFESCPFARWEDKFYELGNTDQDKVSKIPFRFYRESITRMQQCRVESQGASSFLSASWVSSNDHAYALSPECSEPALKDFWSQWKTEANPQIRKQDLMPLQIPWQTLATS